MDRTRIVSRPAVVIASVFLFVTPVACFAAGGVQEKGDSDRTDRSNRSEKAQTNAPDRGIENGAGARPASGRIPVCTEQSPVSELGCSQPEPAGHSLSTRDSTTAVKQSPPGAGLRGSDFSFGESQPSQGTGGVGGGAPYGRSESLDLRKLSLEADDPMAPLTSFGFETSYAASLWGIRGTPGQSAMDYRSTIPLSVLGRSNILRVSLPYAATSSGGLGWGTIEVTDLMTFSEKWGRWGVGAAASLGASGGFGIDAFRAGPALSFVTSKGGWLVGVLSTNTFSKNMALSSIQPVIAYHFGSGWSVGAGELQYQVDWNRRGFATVPVGFQIGKVVQHGSQYLRFSVAPQYNVRNIYGATRWSISIGVAVLLPNN
jgi:hypothetical protein